MIPHLLRCACFCSLFASCVAENLVDIFSQNVKRECDKARMPFLSSSDRVMENWKIEAVKTMVFEGDMILEQDQKSRWSETGHMHGNKAALIQNKWANNTVIYEYASPAPNNTEMITDAMKEWSSKTCIKFNRGTEDAVQITKGKGCYAHLGYLSGNITMSVADICDKGTVVHLLGHVIGLVHQHSRPDRDLFLNVQFHNTALEDTLFLNYKDYDQCQYDYNSVMQYDMFGLSYNGESVFLGRWKGADGLMLSSAIGRDWSKPSDSDAALVNREYGCPAKACSKKATTVKQPDCNHEGLANQLFFEETIKFSKIMDATTDRVISCIWKTEVFEKLNCSRAAIAITLSANLDEGLRRVWLASGCRLFQVEIYDPTADMSYFYCAAQFARKATKVFLSTGRKMYAIAKLYPADWNNFKTKAFKSGSVKFFSIRDIVCAEEINGKCY